MRFRQFLAVIALSAPALAAPTPTIDQLLNLKSVARPRISPDGRMVVYEMSETNWKENAYVTHLWLTDVQSGRAFQLTRGNKSSDNAAWSPDGRWIAFLTEREAPAAEKKEKEDAKPDARQIWLISPLGGEAWMLTKHGAKIDSFRWSEDGKMIAFTAPVPETKATKDRKEKYSDYEVFEEDYEQNQLWTIDVADGAEAKQVTSDAKINVGSFAWSPDGSKIAFTGAANPLLAFGGSADVYLVDLVHDNAVKKIVALEGPDSNPRFSPDGRQLAFTTSLAQPYYFYSNNHIAMVPIDGPTATKPADITDLTSAFDEATSVVDWAPEGLY